jgi:hypothetical protein
VIENQANPPREENGDRQKRHGMDKKRRKKMANARAEVRQNEVRLCPSVLIPDKKCKYGENCHSEHSIDAYMKIRPNDIGLFSN